MNSNFFITKSKRKVKRRTINNKTNIKSKKIKKDNSIFDNSKVLDSEEISSDEDNTKYSENESDGDHATAQEKKVLLAKKYLEEIEKEEKERLENGDLHSSIVNRLREDRLEQTGKLSKKVADKLLKPQVSDFKVMCCKEHKLSITCITITPNNQFVFSGSKDAIIIKWSIESKCKVGMILNKHKENDTKRKEYSHDSSILGLAVSFDNKYLASSDESSVVRIWNTDSLEPVHLFRGHRSSVTGLAFCCESLNLYSCSKDRSVRIWNLDEMSFVETLFGHQCGVTDIDIMSKDRAVTSGESDNTLRIWKVQEESQLIFNGHHGSIDRVKRLDQQHFVSCGDDGQICLWGTLKKKPLSIIQKAHGIDSLNNEPNWISALACLPNSDVIVSGSCDNFLRFWKCEENFRSLTPLFEVPVVGFVNSISFSKNGQCLIAGIGQEHRMGRWFRDKKAKNSIIFIPLNYS